jgi:tRNA(fMet)-specific endonuclease VapC
LKYLFDTNAVILAIDGRDMAFAERLADAWADDIVTSAIVLAEVAYGTARGMKPVAELLEVFIEEAPVMPFDDKAARVYAKLPFRRGGFDRLIAAHALALGLTLVTANVADFADVPGLKLEDWTVR